MQFRTKIAVVVLALLSGSALAAPAPVYIPAPGSTIQGDILLGLGEVGFSDGNEGFFQGRGRVNVPLGGGMWNFETQTGGKAFFEGAGSNPVQVDGYLHLWNRLPNAAWGLFAGANFGSGPQTTAFGVEGKHYVGNMTFGGAAGFATLEEYSGWLLNGEANYYFTPNHRIGLQFAMLGVSGYSVWEVSADFEHRMDNSPFSLFASVSTLGEDSNVSIGTGQLNWTALGGFKVYLDPKGSTLYTHEQNVPWTIRMPLFFEGIPIIVIPDGG